MSLCMSEVCCRAVLGPAKLGAASPGVLQHLLGSCSCWPCSPSDHSPRKAHRSAPSTHPSATHGLRSLGCHPNSCLLPRQAAQTPLDTPERSCAITPLVSSPTISEIPGIFLECPYGTECHQNVHVDLTEEQILSVHPSPLHG